MKRKWRLALVAMAAFVVALVLLIPLFLPPTPAVTYANYSRIEKGMTREQVEQLLGKPMQDRGFMQWQPGASLYWRTENGDHVEVGFDADGHVECATWNAEIESRTFLEKLRDRFPFIAHEPPGPMPVK